MEWSARLDSTATKSPGMRARCHFVKWRSAPGTCKQPGLLHRSSRREGLDDPRAPGNAAPGACAHAPISGRSLRRFVSGPARGAGGVDTGAPGGHCRGVPNPVRGPSRRHAGLASDPARDAEAFVGRARSHTAAEEPPRPNAQGTSGLCSRGPVRYRPDTGGRWGVPTMPCPCAGQASIGNDAPSGRNRLRPHSSGRFHGPTGPVPRFDGRLRAVVNGLAVNDSRWKGAFSKAGVGGLPGGWLWIPGQPIRQGLEVGPFANETVGNK